MQRCRGDASECVTVLSLGELEADRELLPTRSRDSRSVSLVVLRAAAVRASASAAVAVNSAILVFNPASAVFVSNTAQAASLSEANLNGPERSPDSDSVMAKIYHHWRPFCAPRRRI